MRKLEPVKSKRCPYLWKRITVSKRTGEESFVFVLSIREKNAGVHFDKKVLKAESLREAEDEALKLIWEAKFGKDGEKKSTDNLSIDAVQQVTFQQIGLEVVANKDHCRKSTQKNAELHIMKILLPFFEEKGILMHQFNEAIWQDFIKWRLARKPGATIYTTRQYMAQVALRAYHKGILKRPIRLNNPDPKIKVGRVLADHEIAALEKNADFLMLIKIKMGYLMGMRRHEVKSLEWWQVDFDQRTIHIPKKKAKTREDRDFRIHDEVFSMLKELKLRSGGSDWAFPSPEDSTKPINSFKTAWNATRRRAEIKKRTRFHDLRHTFITNALLRYNVEPVKVSEYCGVSLEVIYEVYLHGNADYTADAANKTRYNLSQFAK
jgi:integrase